MSIKKVYSPHDKFFRSAMADIRVAREFFQTHLPDYLRDKVDLDTLKLSPNSYVEIGLQETLSDVLYQVQIAGETAYLYILCEHQSTSDPLMAFRLWQYIINIWSDHLKQTKSKRLPLIVPMVFYNGKKPYSGSRHIRDLIDAPAELVSQVLQDPFHLIDTHMLDDEELRKHLWAGIMAFTMKHIYARDIINVLNQITLELHQLEINDRGSDYIILLLNYALTQGRTEQEKEAILSFIEEKLPPGIGGKAMTVVERLIERDKREWIHQGISQGEHTLFLRQLQKRFSEVPVKYQELIKAADEETLFAWSDRIFDARTLEEIFED